MSPKEKVSLPKSASAEHEQSRMCGLEEEAGGAERREVEPRTGRRPPSSSLNMNEPVWIYRGY